MVIFNALLNLRELKELYSGKPVCVCPLYKGVINGLKTFEATGNPIVLPEYKSLTIYGGTVDAVTGIGEKTWGYIASYNGESLPGEWVSDRDVYSAGTTPTTGAQVAYKLATSEPFKVSQVSIPSLRGENYFFTNGENMDIIYKKEYFWSDES